MATSKTRRVAGFGWRPDLPDARDHLYAVSSVTLKKLPTAVDLRPKFKFAVYNQGNIGSCTANAIAAAIQFDRAQAKQKPSFTPSRLFIYYNERAMEGTVADDAGAQIRDGVKSVVKQGVCNEKIWSYADPPAQYDGGPWPPGAKPAQKPTAACYAEAKEFQVIRYQRLSQTLTQLRGCLAQGDTFVFGFTVYDSLYDANDAPKSILPLPNLGKDKVLGGHAVLAVGYDDAKQVFIVRNSWGAKVQDKGHFYMPYAYINDSSLADDFWVIRAVER